MSATLPPQQSEPPHSRTRPAAVARHVNYSVAASFLCVIFGIVNFFAWEQPANILMTTIFVAIGAASFVMSIGIFLGQRWAFILSGFSGSSWAQNEEVKAFFHTHAANPLPQPYLKAPITQQPAPPVNAQSSLLRCPTCGNPLMFLPEYNRWYCPAEKRILLDNQPQNH